MGCLNCAKATIFFGVSGTLPRLLRQRPVLLLCVFYGVEAAVLAPWDFGAEVAV
jgi:hypothetical protein